MPKVLNNMLTDSLVKIERSLPGVSIICLNRPEKKNALNLTLMLQICNAIDQTAQDPAQRIIILKGEGSVFCSGLDLAEAQDDSKTKESSELLATLLTKIYETHLVTIAAVHGAAFAGGAGLMSACDLVVASEETLFGYPETRRGMVAAQVMSFLVRQLRQRDIRELLLLGEAIDVRQALTMGLINRAVPRPELIPEACRLAKLAMKGAPKATAATKKLLDALYPASFSDDLSQTLKYHQEVRYSEEAKEGIAAFLEKREPLWNK
jgi:methylglutaconyl-CoA hydratase